MSKTSTAISIDDFVALNDEMASLVRAGVPLELGLQGFSRGVSGRLKMLSERLSQRMNAGETLEEAILSERDAFPRMYRFAIEAGMRAGHLPQAMQSLSRYARLLSDARRKINLALIYPAIILLLAYYLLWGISVNAVPFIQDAISAPGENLSDWQIFVQKIGDTIGSLGHFPPLIFVCCLIGWMVSSNYFSRSQQLGLAGLRMIPGLRGALRDSLLANYSELSSILLGYEVPLSEALPLAAETIGDTRLIRDTERLALGDTQGESLSQALKGATAFPPLMRWMIDVGARQGRLVATFRQLSDLYRRRATARMDRFSVLFPLMLTVVIGGGAVLFYGLAVFIPFAEMMKSLGME